MNRYRNMIIRLSLRIFVLCAVMGVAFACGDEAPNKPPPLTRQGMPLLLEENFEKDVQETWSFTDDRAWKVEAEGDRRVLSLVGRSKYKTPVRSPFNRAMRKDLRVADFVMEVRVRSTKKDYAHRDLCLFFGYRDPSHFYYVHLGKKADPHSNSIFLVDGKDRVSIAEDRTDGTPWDDEWHLVRIVRKVETGRIEVFFDDLSKPVMTAQDKTFADGLVGLGSFDDTGQFDALHLWGTKVGN